MAFSMCCLFFDRVDSFLSLFIFSSCWFWWVVVCWFSLFSLDVFLYEVVAFVVKHMFLVVWVVLRCPMWDSLCWKIDGEKLGLVNRLLEAVIIDVVSSFTDWKSLCGGEGLGCKLREEGMCGRGFWYSWVMVVCSLLRLTNVNSQFRLAMTLFIAFKNFYFNAAPRSTGVHSMLSESLLVILIACEQISGSLQPARVVTTLLLLSLYVKFYRFLRSPPIVYLPSKSVFKELTKKGFGTLCVVWRCKQSQVNNRGSNGEEPMHLVCFVVCVMVYKDPNTLFSV